MDKNTPLEIPPLRSALQPKHLYSLATGFESGDRIHLLAAVGGHRAGDVLDVLGYCLSLDEHGNPYALRAYVRASTTSSVGYGARQAVRFAEAGQQERWLSNVRPLRLTEIDITDHAEELALERCPVVAPVAAATPLPQPALGLRKAA